MKYMLLMYADPSSTKAMSRSDRDVIAKKHQELRDALTNSMELLDGAGLDYPWTTTTFRWTEGEPVSLDGPLTSSAEHLTAYYVVDCENPERASDIAREILDFHVTSVEVRRIHT